MAYVEILTGHDLTVEQWDSGIFEEYTGQLWWKNLMGTSEESVIQVKDDIPFVKRISLISILILVWKNRAGKRNRLGDDDSALIRKRLPASGNAELGETFLRKTG